MAKTENNQVTIVSTAAAVFVGFLILGPIGAIVAGAGTWWFMKNYKIKKKG